MIVFLLLGLIAPKIFGAIPPVERVTRVYDGDTITVDLACDFEIMCKGISVRVAGIDTPELLDYRPDVRILASRAKILTHDLTNTKYHRVEIRNLKRDKYFRILADVYSDDKNIADTLTAAGLARPYTGKGPKPW